MTTHLRYLDGCHDAALHDRAPENAPSPPPFSKAENFQQPHLLGSGVYFVLEATVFTMPNLGLHLILHQLLIPLEATPIYFYLFIYLVVLYKMVLIFGHKFSMMK